jgi:hypothetical protein
MRHKSRLVRRYGLLCIGIFLPGLLIILHGQEKSIAVQVPNLTVGTAQSQTSSRQEMPAKTIVDMNEEELHRYYEEQLKSLEFNPHQDQLDHLLTKAGENVERFFDIFFNISALEQVELSQGFLIRPINEARSKIAISHISDNQFAFFKYLILPGNNLTSWKEYRTDKKNRPIDLNKLGGSMITSGYAGYPLFFHPSHQANSRFYYLGQETKENRLHIIAFAQRSEAGDYLAQYYGPESLLPIRFLQQGLLWLDPYTFQVLRIYTRMLPSEKKSSLNEITADIVYRKVRFISTSREFMLPKEIQVELNNENYIYINKHKYSDYQLFSVESDSKIEQSRNKK